jgi:hypothetical protein
LLTRFGSRRIGQTFFFSSFVEPFDRTRQFVRKHRLGEQSTENCAKMSRGSSMSGANNIPLGSRGGPREGTLAQAAASFSGQSLLNPDYLQASGTGSKFGPIASKFCFFPKALSSVYRH